MTQNEINKYEEIALQIPQDHLLEGYHHFRKLELTLNFLNGLGEDLLVLDAACGDGIQAEKIVDAHKIVGVDLSITRIKRAQKRVKNGLFANGDIYSLPFHSNTFDVAILGEIIEHLYEPKKALEEIKRALKPNGYLIVDIPSKSNIVDIILRFFGRNPMWGLYIDKTHVAFHDMGTLTNILESADFNVVDVRGGPCIRYNLPFLGYIVWHKKFWLPLKIMDKILNRIPIIKRYGAIQVFLCMAAE